MVKIKTIYDNFVNFIEIIPIPIVISDSQLNIVLCNNAFSKLTEFDKQEIVNRNIKKFVLHEGSKTINDYSLIENLTTKLKTKTHQYIDVICNFKLYNHNNETFLIQTIQRNLIAEKKEFERIVTHDLLSPLNSIIGFPETMMDDNNLNKEQKEFLNYIKSSGQKLLMTIEYKKIIDKIIDQNYICNNSTIDLIEVLNTIIEDLKTIDYLTNVDFTIKLNSIVVTNERAYYYTDRQLIFQILYNLLKNIPSDLKDSINISINIYLENGNLIINLMYPFNFSEDIKKIILEDNICMENLDHDKLRNISIIALLRFIDGEMIIKDFEEQTLVVIVFPSDKQKKA